MALQIAYPEGSTPSGDITADKLADGVLTNAVRRGALFEGEGHGSVSWAPTTVAAAFSFTAAFTEQLEEHLLGLVSSVRIHVRRYTDGRLEVRNSTGTLVALAGAVIADGVPREFMVTVGLDSVTIEREDGLSASSTPSFSYNTAAVTNYIGNASSGTSRFNGTLYDVKLIDPADDTNTAVYTLDGPSGFENSHPGSTVADATVTGNVSYALVPSSDGGRPVKVGREVYEHFGRNLTSGAAANGSIRLTSVLLNESGSMATGTDNCFVAPVDGTVRVLAALNLAENADTADLAEVILSIGGSFVTTVPFEAGDVAPGTQVLAPISLGIASGQAVQVRLNGLDAGTSLTVSSWTLSVTFYPTPT